MGGTRVDTTAVRAAARRFGAAAEILDGAVRTRLAALRFGSSTAGRVHTARGEDVRAAVGRLGVGMAAWSRAAEEIAAVLAADAQRYLDADAQAAGALG